MYYRSAAQILQLIDGSGQPSARLVEFIATRDDPLELLRDSFERSAVGQGWARWSKTSLWSVDPDSAERFLADASELAPATAARRAKTLRTWLEELAPEHAGPTLEQLRGELLARPLSHFHFSVRTTNVFRREGFEHVHQPVALASAGLLGLRAFGQTSLREVDGLLSQEPPGEDIDELAAALGAGEIHWPASFNAATVRVPAAEQVERGGGESTEESTEEIGWNDLVRLVPEHILAVKVEQLDPPTRTLTFCGRENIETLRELVAYPEHEFRDARGVGRNTLSGTLERILELCRRYPTPEHLDSGTSADPEQRFDPSGFATVLELWEARLSHLDERDAQVILRRSGALAEAETLEGISETLGLTRERIRQLEKRGLERLRSDPSWLSPVRASLDQLRGESSYLWLSELEDDPFVQPFVDRPEFVRYLLNRVIPDGWQAYPWDRDDLLLTAKRTRNPEASYTKLVEALRAATWPAPYSAFLDLVNDLTLADESDLRPLIIQRAQANLVLDDDEHPSEVLHFGQSRDGRVLAFLATRDGPVSLRELQQLFGRGTLPDACVIPRRGQVALPRHFPDFELWEKRLGPLAKRIVEREGPDRQWMARDLLDLAAEEGRLPEWITPWLLTSMLRRSGELEDLGRQRFALERASPQARLQLIPAAIEILEHAGQPLTEAQLRERLRERIEVLDNTFNTLRTSIPLFPIGDGHLGLVTRDLPGGLDAVQAAGEHLEVVLRNRGRGLSFHQALGEVQALSPEHAQWSVKMVAVVARARPTIIANRSGIGLDVWDGVRIPTQPELLLNLLNEGEGVTTVSHYVRVLLDLHGREPSRATLAGIANTLGARLRGELIMLADLVDEPAPVQPAPVQPAPVEPGPLPIGPTPAALPLGHPNAVPPPPQFPGARDLQLPRAARDLYAKLAQEPPADWTALLRRCQAHAGRFAELTQKNEFLPVREARQLAERLPQLIERVRASEDPTALRLAWIAARYFEIADDGELDFTIGGLDDDVAVFNAISGHLEFGDLPFELS